MQEVEYQNEGQLYYRIGELETELASSRRRIENLEQQELLWQGRVTQLVKLLIVTLIGLMVAAIFLIIVGAVLYFH